MLTKGMGDKMRAWIKVISFLIAGSFFLYVIGSLIPYHVNTKENDNDKLVIYTQHPVEFVTPIVRENLKPVRISKWK